MVEQFSSAKQSFVLLNCSTYQSGMEALAHAGASYFCLRAYEAEKPIQTTLGIAAAAAHMNGYPPWANHNFQLKTPV
jgi:hypothetical protein